ncbi:MAG: hypothetical protein ACLP9L_05630, partial [Thermoguttaceae bacterium]
RLTAADENMTEKLRRYILGLALVALTAEQETYLRQGCNPFQPRKASHESLRSFTQLASASHAN